MKLRITRPLDGSHLLPDWQHINIGDYVHTRNGGGYVVRYYDTTHPYERRLFIGLVLADEHGHTQAVELANCTAWEACSPWEFEPVLERVAQVKQSDRIPF